MKRFYSIALAASSFVLTAALTAQSVALQAFGEVTSDGILDVSRLTVEATSSHATCNAPRCCQQAA